MGVRVWAGSAAVVMVLVGGLPAAAATAQAVAPGGSETVAQLQRQLPVDARVAVGRDGDLQRQDSVSDVVLGMRRYHDRAAWLTAAAALVAGTTGSPVASAAGESSADETAHDGPSGTVVEAVPAGDLTGDGADDVVAFTFDVGTDDVLLQGRAGTDAAVLWERTAGADGALAWPLHADVDGDGFDDLSVHGLRIHDETVVEECEDFDGEQWCWPVEYHATFTWTVGVASGATGATLWSRDVAGDIDEVYAESQQDGVVVHEYGGRYELESTNLYVVGLHAGDLAGNGRHDVILDALDVNVVETYDETSAGPAWVDEGSLQVRAQTRADVVDAVSGQTRKSLSDTAEGRISFLSPAPDAVGGPGPDLLWDTTVAPDQTYECLNADVFVDWVSYCTDEAEGGWAVELSMLDGATLEPAWTTVVAEGWFGFPLDEDLDGDGRGDLMMLSFDDDGYVTTALSGVTGATLWEQRSPDDWAFPVVVAALDDVPGDDLVTVSFAWGFDDDSRSIVVERRSGATGEVLSSTRHSLPPFDEDANGLATLAYAAGSPDGDGDAVGDLTVGWVQASYHYDDETGEEHLLSLDSAGVAESGFSGAVRRELSVAGAAALLLPIDDLDGDNLGDVVDERYHYDPDSGQETVQWTAAPFTAGPELWTASARGDYPWLRPAGDQDGELGNELLLSTYFSDAGRVSSSVSSISGRTGSERWTLSTR